MQGDAPIIGAGTWAKDSTCAVSATGHGEVFIQEAAGSSVSARMEYGGVGLSEVRPRCRCLRICVRLLGSLTVGCVLSVRQAIDKTLSSMDALWPQSGGMVAVDFAGNVEFGYSTGGMYRAWRHQNGSAGARIWGD